MRRSVARSLAVAALTATVLGGCDSSTGNKEPKVTLSTSGSAASVAQGGNTTVLVFIARQNFAKALTLSVEGAPPGVTVLITPTQADNGVTSGSLLIAANGSADPGSAILTVKATGDGITDQTVTVNLTVTVTGNFTLGVLSPTVTIAQGGGGVVSVAVSRTGNNAGNVSLAASGLPAGVTASFFSSPTTTTGSSMTLAATAGVAAGTYPVTITGTSPGLTDQTTAVSLVVVAPPATVSVSIPFCTDGLPAWFAYQNEGFNWQQVVASGVAFTFAATQKVGVAFAFAAGARTQLNIFYLSRAELAAFNDRDCSGPKNFTGSVANLAVGQSVKVVMGTTAANASSFSPTFSLNGVNARILDFVATSGTVNTTTNGDFLAPDRMIIRRGLNLATGAAIPALDFSLAEAFAPAQNSLTISGPEAGDDVLLNNTLWTATSTFATAHSAQLSAGSGTATLFSTPAAQMVTGDLHELSVEAFHLSQDQTFFVGRQYVEYFGAPTDHTAPLGPQLTLPTISVVSSSPYSRVRAQLPVQPEYNTSTQFSYFQAVTGGFRTVQLFVSAAHLGGTPATWDVTIPDFAGVSGLNNAWMLVPNQSTEYLLAAFSGRTDVLFGAAPSSGDVLRLAYRDAFTSTTQPLRTGNLTSNAIRTSNLTSNTTRSFSRLRQYLRR